MTKKLIVRDVDLTEVAELIVMYTNHDYDQDPSVGNQERIGALICTIDDFSEKSEMSYPFDLLQGVLFAYSALPASHTPIPLPFYRILEDAVKSYEECGDKAVAQNILTQAFEDISNDYIDLAVESGIHGPDVEHEINETASEVQEYMVYLASLFDPDVDSDEHFLRSTGILST